ncbi:hypothetical protein [Anaerovirgula multivorans]|uniref:hypothetical protein n=1 Tax=Anaerovirgula multivorans TaxID=312168 RepID=UPI00159579D6|nr:hypothetical protein [Anaerovirgula multivorans]
MARKEEVLDRDIDFLVKFQEERTLLHLITFKNQLEEFVKMGVKHIIADYYV